MPIYEYECTICGHKFEELVLSGTRTQVQPILDRGCPKCGEHIEKLVSVSSFTIDQWMGTPKG